MKYCCEYKRLVKDIQFSHWIADSLTSHNVKCYCFPFIVQFHSLNMAVKYTSFWWKVNERKYGYYSHSLLSCHQLMRFISSKFIMSIFPILTPHISWAIGKIDVDWALLSSWINILSKIFKLTQWQFSYFVSNLIRFSSHNMVFFTFLTPYLISLFDFNL